MAHTQRWYFKLIFLDPISLNIASATLLRCVITFAHSNVSQVIPVCCSVFFSSVAQHNNSPVLHLDFCVA